MKYPECCITQGSGLSFLSIVTPATLDWLWVKSIGASDALGSLGLIIFWGLGALKRLAIILAYSVAPLVYSIHFISIEKGGCAYSARKLGRESAFS